MTTPARYAQALEHVQSTLAHLSRARAELLEAFMACPEGTTESELSTACHGSAELQDELARLRDRLVDLAGLEAARVAS